MFLHKHPKKYYSDTKKDSIWIPYYICKKDNGNILTTEYINCRGEDDTKYTYVSEYDTNLNLISRQKYIFDFTLYSWYPCIKEKNNNITVFSPFYLQIITPDTMYVNPDYEADDLEFLNDSISYTLNHDSLNHIHLKKFDFKHDSVLNDIIIFDSTNIHINSTEPTKIKILKNSIYILESTDYTDGNNPYLAKFDTSLNYISSAIYETDYIELLAKPNCFDEYNYFFYTLSGDLGFSYFRISKIDTNLNLIFEKFIDYENASITNSIFATLDGGAVVSSNTYNDNFGYYGLMHKFDSNGHLPVYIKENNQIKISDFAVYPNPADDLVHIKKAVQVKEAEFVLFNTSGQKILQRHLIDRSTTIDVGNLPSGVYIYNIFENNQKTDEGKIVVK